MNQQRIEQIKGYLGMMAMLHDNGDAGDALAIIEQLEAEVQRLTSEKNMAEFEMVNYRASYRGTQTQRELDKAIYDHNTKDLKEKLIYAYNLMGWVEEVKALEGYK